MESERRETSRRCLLVTAHEHARAQLVGRLHLDGFVVETVRTANEARAILHPWAPHVIVVDVVLPDASGIDLCRWVRSWTPAPLVLLAEGEVDGDLRMVALAAGADDVVPEGGDPDIVVARLTAMLQRIENVWSGTTRAGRVLRAGSLTIDTGRHQAYVDGAPVRLTPREFALLQLFMSHPGEVLPRSTIIDMLWGTGAMPASNVVERQVRSLRHKLQPDSVAYRPSAFIETLPRVGYRLRAGVGTPSTAAHSRQPHPDPGG
jgi:DNA-binding response OmpR family regulator